MTPLGRRLYPLGVLLAGIVAAAVVAVMAGRDRARERDASDRRAVAMLSAGLRARLDLLSRTVRGPAQAFDLGTLGRPEVAGVLRLSYAQSEGVTAVTLLDRDGNAIVPAVFVSRGSGAEHPGESLDDLNRFAQEIPHQQALARGRAVRGPYATVRGDGARVAVAEAVPVSDGTQTWVLAAEIDAANLLEGLYPPDPDGEPDVALVAPSATVGRMDRVPAAARAAVTALLRSHNALRGPDVIAGEGWRAAVAPAPGGVDGVLVVAWAGEAPSARRARERELALAVIVATIMAALAAALWVLNREPAAGAADAGDAGSEAGAHRPSAGPTLRLRAQPSVPGAPPGEPVTDAARALGAVIKELSNPIAATTAAARLMSSEPGVAGRVAETLQRSAVRLERAFRRVTRLARAGEEHARREVDLVALVRREAEAMRPEFEQGGLKLALALPAAGDADGCVALADEEDVLLLVEVLLDAARAVAPARTEVSVAVAAAPGGGPELSVTDRGPLTARERAPLLRLVEAPRTELAAPALAWALAARIARDQHATLEVLEEPGAVRTAVRFEPARSAPRGGAGPAPRES